jgi:hypothetical protein
LIESAHRDSTVEQDGEPLHRAALEPERHCPSLTDVAQGQVHQLEDRLVRGQQRPFLLTFRNVAFSDSIVFVV